MKGPDMNILQPLLDQIKADGENVRITISYDVEHKETHVEVVRTITQAEAQKSPNKIGFS